MVIGLERRLFAYLKFELIEDLFYQIRSVELINRLGVKKYFRYVLKYYFVIFRFARFFI